VFASLVQFSTKDNIDNDVTDVNFNSFDLNFLIK